MVKPRFRDKYSHCFFPFFFFIPTSSTLRKLNCLTNGEYKIARFVLADIPLNVCSVFHCVRTINDQTTATFPLKYLFHMTISLHSSTRKPITKINYKEIKRSLIDEHHRKALKTAKGVTLRSNQARSS